MKRIDPDILVIMLFTFSLGQDLARKRLIAAAIDFTLVVLLLWLGHRCRRK